MAKEKQEKSGGKPDKSSSSSEKQQQELDDKAISFQRAVFIVCNLRRLIKKPGKPDDKCGDVGANSTGRDDSDSPFDASRPSKSNGQQQPATDLFGGCSLLARPACGHSHGQCPWLKRRRHLKRALTLPNLAANYASSTCNLQAHPQTQCSGKWHLGARSNSPPSKQDIGSRASRQQLKFRPLGRSQAVACPIWARLMDELDRRLLESCKRANARQLRNSATNELNYADAGGAVAGSSSSVSLSSTSDNEPHYRRPDLLERTASDCYAHLVRAPESSPLLLLATAKTTTGRQKRRSRRSATSRARALSSCSDFEAESRGSNYSQLRQQQQQLASDLDDVDFNGDSSWQSQATMNDKQSSEEDEHEHESRRADLNQEESRRDSSASNAHIRITRCDADTNECYDECLDDEDEAKSSKARNKSKPNKTLKRFRSALNLFEPIGNSFSSAISAGSASSAASSTSKQVYLPASPIKRRLVQPKTPKSQPGIQVPKISVDQQNEQLVNCKETRSSSRTRQDNCLLEPTRADKSKMLQIARQRRPSASNQTTVNVNQQALFSAVERNQLDRVRSILSSKSADVNSLSGDKLTCLDIAVLLRNTRMVSLLLEYGAKESSVLFDAEQRAHQLRSLYMEARQLVEDLSRSVDSRRSPSLVSETDFSHYSSSTNALTEEEDRQLQYWRRRLEFFMEMRYEFERLKPPDKPELVALEVKGETCLSLKIVCRPGRSTSTKQTSQLQAAILRSPGDLDLNSKQRAETIWTGSKRGHLLAAGSLANDKTTNCDIRNQNSSTDVADEEYAIRLATFNRLLRERIMEATGSMEADLGYEPASLTRYNNSVAYRLLSQNSSKHFKNLREFSSLRDMLDAQDALCDTSDYESDLQLARKPANSIDHDSTAQSFDKSFVELDAERKRDCCFNIITKYLVQWSETPSFKKLSSMIVYKSSKRQIDKCLIGSLPTGRVYFVRVAAGNHKGYSEWRYAIPAKLTPSGWRQVEGTKRRLVEQIVLKKFAQLIWLKKQSFRVDIHQFSSDLLNPLKLDLPARAQIKSSTGKNSGGEMKQNKKQPGADRWQRSGPRNQQRAKNTTNNERDNKQANKEDKLINMVLQEKSLTTSRQMANNRKQSCRPKILSALSGQTVDDDDGDDDGDELQRSKLFELGDSTEDQQHELESELSQDVASSSRQETTGGGGGLASEAASSAPSSVRRNLKSFFQSNSFKFHKLSNQNKRGLYLCTIIYHDVDGAASSGASSKPTINFLEVPGKLMSASHEGGRIIVTNDDRLPVIEIIDELVSLAALLSDFYWLLKISGTGWVDIKKLRQQLQKSHSTSTLHLKVKLLLAIEQMQLALNLENIGRLFYKPIQSHDGSIVICTCRQASSTKLVSSLSTKWVARGKIMPSHLRKISDALMSQHQNQLATSQELQRHQFTSGSQQRLTSGDGDATARADFYCSDACALVGSRNTSTGASKSHQERSASSSTSSLASHCAASANAPSCKSSNSSLASGGHLYENEHGSSSSRVKCATCGKQNPTFAAIGSQNDTFQAPNQQQHHQHHQQQATNFNSNSLGLFLGTSSATTKSQRLSTSSAIYPSTNYGDSAALSSHFTSRHSQPISLGVGVPPQRSSQYLMLASLTIYDLLLYYLREMIHFDRYSHNKLPGGLYLGFLQLSATVESMRLLVPRSRPNSLPCIRMRDNAHVSKAEWQLLSDLLGKQVNNKKKLNAPSNQQKTTHHHAGGSSDRAKSASPSRLVGGVGGSSEARSKEKLEDSRLSSNLNATTDCIVTLSSETQTTVLGDATSNIQPEQHHRSSLNEVIMCDDNCDDEDNVSTSCPKSQASQASNFCHFMGSRPGITTIGPSASSRSTSTTSMPDARDSSFGGDVGREHVARRRKHRPEKCIDTTRIMQNNDHQSIASINSFDVMSPEVTFVRQVGSAARRLIDKLINCLPRHYDVHLDDMVSMLATLKEPHLNRIYHLELIEFSSEVSVILLIPPVENICRVTTQENSSLLSANDDYMFLPIQFFETLHIGTYKPELLIKYSRLSVSLETELTLASHDHRQAFSSSELKNSKCQLDNLQELVSITENLWRQMRWLTDVVSFGRDKLSNATHHGVQIGHIWKNFDSPEAFSCLRLASPRASTCSHDRDVFMESPNDADKHDNNQCSECKVDDNNPFKCSYQFNMMSVPRVETIVLDEERAINFNLSRKRSSCGEDQIVQVEPEFYQFAPEAYHISMQSDMNNLLINDKPKTRFDWETSRDVNQP